MGSAAPSDAPLATGVDVAAGAETGAVVAAGGTWQPAMPKAVMAGIRKANRMTGQTLELRNMLGTLDQPVGEEQTTFNRWRIFKIVSLSLPRSKLFSKPIAQFPVFVLESFHVITN